MDVPFKVGDGRDKSGGGVRGFGDNGDATVGLLYQFLDQVDYMPAMALQTNFRFRTGYRSSPFDMQVRLLMTNEYDSGVRSHINLSGGSREDLLRREDGGWKIARRTIVLDQTVLDSKSLSTFF